MRSSATTSGMVRYSSATLAPLAFLAMDLRHLSCRLSLFACSGGCGKGECGISTGEVADSGELPAGEDERGVRLVGYQFARVFGDLALPIGAAFAADSAQGGGVATAF